MVSTSRQRSNFLFLVTTLFLVFMTGCMESSESEDGMLSITEEGSIHFLAFVEELPTEGETDAEYEKLHEVTSDLYNSSNISVTETGIYIKSEETLEEYGHLIDGFPTYIIIDHTGIILNTSDIDEISKFIKSKQ